MAELCGVVRDLTHDMNRGILLETLRAGSGTEGPKIGDNVYVHYVGKLEDGTVFDNSRSRGEPLRFKIGKMQVIKAWDCAIANMRKGELARITCSPEFAFGETGKPPTVPPNATVIYEVELIDWKEVDLSPKQDGGILKRMEKQGLRVATPNDGARVTIKYSGSYNDTIFDEREVTFIQGEGEEEGIIPGVEIAAKKMKVQEINRLLIAPKYAYGKKGCPEFNIPPDATLVYTVEMISFEKDKEAWEMDVGQKIEQSKIIKEKGTENFKKGHFKWALANYKKIVKFLEYETSGLQGDEPEQRRQLLLAAYLNMAMCHLKLEQHRDTEEACNKALELDPQNVKALYRRGQARLGVCEYPEAAEDFSVVVRLEPGNRAARNQELLCRQRVKQAYSKEKELYTNMFHKMEQKSDGRFSLYQTMPEVGEWNNDMARNMIPLQDEQEAFEDVMDLDVKDMHRFTGV